MPWLASSQAFDSSADAEAVRGLTASTRTLLARARPPQGANAGEVAKISAGGPRTARTMMVLGLLFSCSTPQRVEFGRDFVLALGGSASLGAAGEIRFLRVVADSRCPRSTECAASGVVTIEAAIGPPATASTVELSVLDRDIGEPAVRGVISCAPVDGRVVRLRDVSPWPPSRRPVPSADYRATFVLASTCAPEADSGR